MAVVPLPLSTERARRDTHADAARETRAPGSGALHFEKVRGTTVLTQSIAASPLRLLHPKNSGRAAWVYAATYGGGLLGGDAIALDVNVGPGASAMLSTQASTKVYRADTPASQRLHVHVADGSLLVLLPDPVTPFASSQYVQEQQIALAGSANLIAIDWMTAGRMSAGERWQFTSYASRTWLRRDGRVVLHDATRLTPDDGDVSGRLGRFNCLAWAVVIGPALRAAALHLAGALGEAPAPRRADLLISAAPLDNDGVLLRIAGTSAQQVGALLRQHLNFVPSLLGDDPWTCKS